jgi:hypothetical protein
MLLHAVSLNLPEPQRRIARNDPGRVQKVFITSARNIALYVSVRGIDESEPHLERPCQWG